MVLVLSRAWISKRPIASNRTVNTIASKCRNLLFLTSSHCQTRLFSSNHAPTPVHRAYIALGSNTGDRLQMIEHACNEMDRRGIRVQRTSGLWETKAMYVTEQPDFLNGACEVKTVLQPMELLDSLQAIERDMGRIKLVDKGPRNIDLDILLYDNESVNTQRLNVPHTSMLEREFVLRPLCQLIPEKQLSKLESSRKTLQQHLDALKSVANSDGDVSQISSQTSLGSRIQSLAPLISGKKSTIMSILNLTPDSFSDGGKHSSMDVSALQQSIQDHISSGASIIDIGGQSTRPGAQSVTAAEELQRILPAIDTCQDLPVAVSVDTYRAEVARHAIQAGASIINDISGGTLDAEMYNTVAKAGCTYVLMHTRGTPETMRSLTDYGDDVIHTIALELADRLKAAEKAGVRRWRIILDPGIGFAKTTSQNLEILRRFKELRQHPLLRDMAWVVGPSRKNFIGGVTGVREPHMRGYGTAVAVAACVQGGADVVRVHDTEEMAEVVKMADAIWRH